MICATDNHNDGQACEQLNAWLGGFEQILKRMTGTNFDWFLHSMLFYHTQQVIERQLKRTKEAGKEHEDDSGEDEDEDEDEDERMDED